MSGGEKNSHVIGVDLGGSKILAGVFDSTTQLRGAAKVSTKSYRGADAVVDRIVRTVEYAADEADMHMDQIAAVAVGIPGVVDSTAGTVKQSWNLGWRDFPLNRILQEKLKKTVLVQNDCMMAMKAIYRTELEGKPGNVVGIFVGTGVGVAAVLENRLVSDPEHPLLQIAHQSSSETDRACDCGRRGCLHSTAGRNGILSRLKQSIATGAKTSLNDLILDETGKLKSGHLRKAIRRGDTLVKEAVETSALHLGTAIGRLMDGARPDVVVLGGGIIEALGDTMMPIIRKTAAETMKCGECDPDCIIESKLADQAAILGAAMLAFESMGE